MSKLDDLARETAGHFAEKSGDAQAAFDPGIIVTIAGFIADIVETIIESCNQEPPEAAAIANEPSWWHRFLLRRHLRKELGRRGYRKNGRSMYYALLETGRTVDGHTISELYEEISED